MRAGHALVPDHDQVGVLLLGHIEDRVRRLALTGDGLDLDAGVVHVLGRIGERRVDVLVRAQRVLDVAGRLEPLLAQAPCGTGSKALTMQRVAPVCFAS